MTALILSPTSFDDVDLFSEWEIGLGWDIESTQLSPGENRIDFDHVELPGMVLGHFCSRQSMYNAFSVPEGMVILVFSRRELPVNWCGRQISPSLLGIVRSPHEHHVTLPGGWDSYEFMISESLIHALEIFPANFFARTSRFEDAFLPLSEPETSQFLTRMDGFFGRLRSARHQPGVEVEELFDFVVNGLQRVFDAGIAARGISPRPTRRADIISKAQELLRANVDFDLTADVMAQSLGVSYRVLNYAFLDAFGVSPYQYALTGRLHAVRRELKTSNSSIAEVCVSYGFSTPSRFARQYRRLFGELPSETRIKQKSGRIR